MVEPGRRPRVPIRQLAGLSTRRAGKDKDSRSAVEDVGMRRERHRGPMLLSARREVLAILFALLLAPGLALADPIGPVTKLPLPRFASLKTDRVNLREGPSKDHATKWVYRARRASGRNHRRVRDMAQGSRFRGRRGVGPAFAAVRPTNRAGHAEQEGRELEDLHPAIHIGRVGRYAAGGSDRQRPKLRRVLVPGRRRWVQGIC